MTHTQRNYAQEVVTDIRAETIPNLRVAERALAQADKLRAVNAGLLAALQNYRAYAGCGCSIPEIQSGHKIGCMLPQLDEEADAAIARAMEAK